MLFSIGSIDQYLVTVLYFFIGHEISPDLLLSKPDIDDFITVACLQDGKCFLIAYLNIDPPKRGTETMYRGSAGEKG